MAMTDAVEAAETAVEPGKARLLHTMLRVKDLDASLDFYTDKLGMKLLRKRDYPRANSRWPLSVMARRPTARSSS